MYKLLSMAEIEGAQALYKRLDGLVEIVALPPDRATALAIIGEFDGYLASLHFRADRAFLDAATRLRAIFTPSTGLDHIDLDYAAEKGVWVYGMKNDREFLDNVTATAELALALMLVVARRIPWGFDAAKRGEWARDRFKGRQMSGKTMGILGYGRLGTMMGQYARALRMRVIACDTRPIEDTNVTQVSFDELIRQSDVLSIHVPLDKTTRGIIDREAFLRMKPNLVLVNTSRGAVIDETTLIEALERGYIAGAGVDVIDGEWREDICSHPLIRYANEHENLLITPHIGGVCYEAQTMALNNTLEKVGDFFRHDCDPIATELLIRSKMN